MVLKSKKIKFYSFKSILDLGVLVPSGTSDKIGDVGVLKSYKLKSKILNYEIS